MTRDAAQGSPICLGSQSFETIRRCGGFYVDKTAFVADWWRQDAAVTLLTRPRRFGKTLLLDTVRCFFSPGVTDLAALFEGLSVWQASDMRSLAGSIPVIRLSWSGCGGSTFESIRDSLWVVTDHLYDDFRGLLQSPKLSAEDHRWQEDFAGRHRTEAQLVDSIRCLCRAVCHATGVKPLLLIDEVDTPLVQTAAGACRDEAAKLLARILTRTLAENPWFGRGLMAGIVSHALAPLLSGVRELVVDSVRMPVYSTCCGFTAAEVQASLGERGWADRAESVRAAYEGWRLGADVLYSPWEMTNFLLHGELRAWWVNSGGRTRVDELLMSGGAGGMASLAELLQGRSVAVTEGEAPWTMLWESGYLTAAAASEEGRRELVIPSDEVKQLLAEIVSCWVPAPAGSWAEVLQALAENEEGYAEWVVNQLWQAADRWAGDPEGFSRALALALMGKLRGRFVVTMQERGPAAFDVLLRPLDPVKDEAFRLALAVKRSEMVGTLEDAAAALLQEVSGQTADAGEARFHRAAMVFGDGAACVRTAG